MEWKGEIKKSVMRGFDFIGACLFTLELVAPSFFFSFVSFSLPYFIVSRVKKVILLEVGWWVVPQFSHRLVVYSLLGMRLRRKYGHYGLSVIKGRTSIVTSLCQG